MESQLSGPHQKTYQRVFQHPMPHNLQWRELSSMLGALPDADAVEDSEGNLTVERHGQTLRLHRPRGKDLADEKELAQIRHFLDHSRALAPASVASGAHLLVVIDHHEAKIYSTETHGSVPQSITPYDPHGFNRSLHYNQDESDGQRKPEQKTFYEAVAKTLHGAQQILLFGAGTGSSSAMEHLLAELKLHHPDIASRVVSSVVVDEHHLTEDQLLAKARDLFVAV
jgi:hypothetical protein